MLVIPAECLVLVRFLPRSVAAPLAQRGSSCDSMAHSEQSVFAVLVTEAVGQAVTPVIACSLLPWVCLCGQLTQDLISHSRFKSLSSPSEMAPLG